MAKKTVAGYRDKSKAKTFTKIILPVKNPETGAYFFKEEIIPSEKVKEFISAEK